MAKVTIYNTEHKFVGTWVPVKDVALLRKLATDSNVTLAAYVRAILVDAVQEELAVCVRRPKASKSTTVNSASNSSLATT